jgi:hypothetical protein
VNISETKEDFEKKESHGENNRGTGTLLHERIAIVNDGDSLFSPTSSLFFKYLWPSGDKVVSLHHQLLIFHLILWLVNQEK